MTVASSPVTWLMVIVFAAAMFMSASDAAKNLTLWKAMATLPEPEHCALCGGEPLGSRKTLLRLDTGETVPCPEPGASCIKPALYCLECRAKIGQVINEGKISLDSYVWACSYGGDAIYIFPFWD